MRYLRLMFDRFTLALLATVAVAIALPARGAAAGVADAAATAAIALLFFLHGARLSRAAMVAGAAHWRLQMLVFACTFALFPLLGIVLRPALQPLTGPVLYAGVLYLCALPATVQSAIAFTSLARGNVPAAICSAAASSLLGIVLTPILVMLLLDTDAAGGADVEAVGRIVLELLVPFAAGQVARRWLGDWIERHRGLVTRVDQGSILLIVYSAFGASVIAGLWQAVPPLRLLALLGACCVLLSVVLVAVWWLARALGFGAADRITILFAGSKKSMATGVPMAQVLFAPAAIGPMILPLMVFHQLQLMVCAVLARQFARRARDGCGGCSGLPAARPAEEADRLP